MPKRFACLILIGMPLVAGAQVSGPWQMEPSETTADLRGVHAVGGGVVWASGTGGTVLRSQDSGFEWQQCAIPPGAEKLDFRAIWAWDDQTAVVMSSGPGELSRLYQTTDGCAHWTLVYTNREPGGFFDAMYFVNEREGLVLGDPTTSSPAIAPVEGGYFAFRIRVTHDGSKTWAPAVDTSSPATPGTELHPYPGESFFAASNSSVAVSGNDLWLGTSRSRVLHANLKELPFQAAICSGAGDPASNSCGIPWSGWTSVAAPLATGSDSAGIFSLAFRDAMHGIAVGGDYTKPGVRTGTAAWTGDGGRRWAAGTTPPGGYRSAVAWDAQLRAWITVGPNGSDLSRDGGKTWQPIEGAPAGAPKGGEWNALSLPWAVGPHGRIGKLNRSQLPAAPR